LVVTAATTILFVQPVQIGAQQIFIQAISQSGRTILIIGLFFGSITGTSGHDKVEAKKKKK
jgi:hypothetical protein